MAYPTYKDASAATRSVRTRSSSAAGDNGDPDVPSTDVLALPGLIPGTAQTWKASGGDYAITLTSLANGSAREGAKGEFYDATFGLPVVYGIRLEADVASAATAGLSLDLYLGYSDSGTAGTNNPGNLTGADAALSNPSELIAQLTFAGSLVMSNARGTNVQKQYFTATPLARYVVPLVYNQTGQALGSTAGNFVISVTPYYRKP